MGDFISCHKKESIGHKNELDKTKEKLIITENQLEKSNTNFKMLMKEDEIKRQELLRIKVTLNRERELMKELINKSQTLENQIQEQNQVIEKYKTQMTKINAIADDFVV